MNHPDIQTLLALFDGELSDIETARLERHTETCADCRHRLAELDETSMALAGVIAGLDAAEPASWPTERPGAPDVIPLSRRFASSGTLDVPPGSAPPETRTRPSPPPFEPEPAPVRSQPHPLRWAAGILLLAGAGAAAAIYGRPWVETPAPESSPATVTAPADAAGPNVLNVTPVDGSLDVSLTGTAEPTRIVVAFADQGDVRIEATGPDELHVQNPRGSVTLDLGATPATLRITFPSSLSSGTIRVDGRTIARVSAGRLDRTGQVEGVTLTAEAADRS